MRVRRSAAFVACHSLFLSCDSCCTNFNLSPVFSACSMTRQLHSTVNCFQRPILAGEKIVSRCCEAVRVELAATIQADIQRESTALGWNAGTAARNWYAVLEGIGHAEPRISDAFGHNWRVHTAGEQGLRALCGRKSPPPCKSAVRLRCLYNHDFRVMDGIPGIHALRCAGLRDNAHTLASCIGLLPTTCSLQPSRRLPLVVRPSLGPALRRSIASVASLLGRHPCCWRVSGPRRPWRGSATASVLHSRSSGKATRSGTSNRQPQANLNFRPVPPRVERERWQSVSRGGFETLGTAFPIKNGPSIVSTDSPFELSFGYFADLAPAPFSRLSSKGKLQPDTRWIVLKSFFLNSNSVFGNNDAIFSRSSSAFERKRTLIISEIFDSISVFLIVVNSTLALTIGSFSPSTTCPYTFNGTSHPPWHRIRKIPKTVAKKPPHIFSTGCHLHFTFRFFKNETTIMAP